MKTFISALLVLFLSSIHTAQAQSLEDKVKENTKRIDRHAKLLKNLGTTISKHAALLEALRKSGFEAKRHQCVQGAVAGIPTTVSCEPGAGQSRIAFAVCEYVADRNGGFMIGSYQKPETIFEGPRDSIPCTGWRHGNGNTTYAECHLLCYRKRH